MKAIKITKPTQDEIVVAATTWLVLVGLVMGWL